MIKVLHIIETSGPGGAETVFREIARGLDPSKFESRCIVPADGWLSQSLQTDGIPVEIMGLGRTADLTYLGRLVRLVRRERISVIQSHLLGSNVYAALVGAVCRVPVVGTFHGQVDVSSRDRFLSLKCRILNAGADRLVFVSQHLRRFFLASTCMDPAITTCVYNGIDQNRFRAQGDRAFRAELGLSDQDVLVGALGNMRLAKGYDTLLHVAAILKEEYRSLRFVIVGDPAPPALAGELSSLHRELGLGETVRYAGFRRDVERVLNSFDIFALTSRSEGFSIATVEAMACGLPVIVTRCGGPEEIVHHNVDGLVVDGESPIAFASALRRLIDDRALRVSLGLAARQSASLRFSREAMVTGYSTIYEYLMRTRLSRAATDGITVKSRDRVA